MGCFFYVENKGGECNVKVHCNNQNCKFYNEQSCTAVTVFYINRQCVTFQKRPRDDLYKKTCKPFEARKELWAMDNQTDINHEPVIRGSRNKILK